MTDSKVKKKTICMLMGLRLSCLREFEEKLAQFRQTEYAIREEMLGAAPREIRHWITEKLVIEDLLRHGTASRSILLDEEGFGGFVSVEALIRRLRVAWRPTVTVRIMRPKSDRVEVTFAVRMA